MAKPNQNQDSAFQRYEPPPPPDFIKAEKNLLSLGLFTPSSKDLHKVTAKVIGFIRYDGDRKSRVRHDRSLRDASLQTQAIRTVSGPQAHHRAAPDPAASRSPLVFDRRAPEDLGRARAASARTSLVPAQRMT
jgi:hypothetical protein